MHVYLAGPMSGIEKFNYPAFDSAASVLRDLGYEVTNPVELDHETGVSGVISHSYGIIDDTGWAQCLSRDLSAMLASDVDGVVVLPGWERSKGASLEVHVARALGKQILSYPDMRPVPEDLPATVTETILEEAQRLVGGDRGDDYGHPRDDFAKTAGAWNALFGWDCTPAQVALAMIVVKLSRLQETPHKRDSIVDIAGYARTYEMVLEREGKAARHYPAKMPPAETKQVTLDDVKESWERVSSGWDDLTQRVAEEDEKLRHNFLLRKFRAEKAYKKGYRLPW